MKKNELTVSKNWGESHETQRKKFSWRKAILDANAGERREC